MGKSLNYVTIRHNLRFIIRPFEPDLKFGLLCIGRHPLIKEKQASLANNLKLFIVGEPITNYSCCQGDAGSPGCCVGKVFIFYP